jgi:hypothetical protein
MSTTDPPPGALDYRAQCEAMARLLDKQIFFVGGAEKSGTSWLQYLLDAHPQVSCGGESHFIDSLFPAIKEALEKHNGFVLNKNINPMRYELGAEPDKFDERDLLFIVASAILISLLKQARGKSPIAVGERTPKNVHVFTGLSQLIRGAKCVHIVRDPRDAGVSEWYNIRRSVPAEMRSGMVTVSDLVRQYAGYWVVEIELGLKFAASNPDRYCEVRYEDLLGQPVPTFARVCRFLGVDDRSETLQLCIDKTSFARLSGGRARGQEDEESFFRKGIIGDWKNHLAAETNEQVVATAGALMRRYGYI